MLTFLSIQYVLVLSLIYLVLCTVVYYVLPRKGFAVRQRPTSLAALVFAIALLIRLVPVLALPRGAEYDIESFRRVAETFLAGEGVYSSPVVAGRHPYLPFQVYLIGMAMWFAKGTGLPFVAAVKLAPILADAGLVVLIFYAVRQLRNSTVLAFISSLLYAFNPVSILVSAYHGQFDAESTFLLTLSWYLWRFSNRPKRRVVLSALILGFAILNKTWPALFLPIFLLRLGSGKRCLTYSLITLAVPVIFTVLYVIIFREDPSPLLRRALTHAGVPGWWGPGAVVNILRETVGWGERVLNWLTMYSRWLVFIGVGLACWITRRQDSIEALTTAILVLYVSTSGFGVQWLIWVIPFALMAGDVRGIDWYVLGHLVFLIPAYYGYNLDQTLSNLISFERMAVLMQLCSLPAWVITLVWVVRRLAVAGCDKKKLGRCPAQTG